MAKRKSIPSKVTVSTPAWKRWWPYAVLAAAAFGVYANALSNGFVSDDNFQLLNNPLVTDWRKIPVIFRTNIWAFAGAEVTNYFRPLQMLLYMALYYTVGFDAFTFHLVMVLIHVANTLLVYALTRRLLDSQPAALVAAALFAVHPIHTEAVVWVAVLPDVLITLIALASLWFFVQQEGRPKGWAIAGHSGLYLLALLTKETGVVLMGLLAAYEWFCLRRTLREMWKNYRFYGALALTFGFYLALRIRALGGLAPAQNFYYRLAPKEYFLSIVVTLGEYLSKLVLPINLNYYHLFEPTRGITLQFVVSLAAVVAVLALIAARRLSPPVVAYGFFWILSPLAPVMNLTGVGENVFTERYLYLPSVGFVWAVGWLWARLADWQKKAALAAVVVILVAGASATVIRNPDWHDDIRLFNVSLEKSPRSGTLHANLGWFYYQRGDFDHAIEKYHDAIRLQPDTALFHNNLGNALAMKGRPQEAIGEIRKAIQLKPDYAEAHMNLGLALEALGDKKGAEASHRRALELRPKYAEALTALGLLRMKEKDYPAAIDLLRKAVEARPQYTEAHINLGVAYNDTEHYAEGAEAFRKAIEVGSKFPSIYVAHYNLGISYAKLNAPAAAAAEFTLALQLRPDFQPAKDALEQIQPMLKGSGLTGK